MELLNGVVAGRYQLHFIGIEPIRTMPKPLTTGKLWHCLLPNSRCETASIQLNKFLLTNRIYQYKWLIPELHKSLKKATLKLVLFGYLLHLQIPSLYVDVTHEDMINSFYSIILIVNNFLHKHLVTFAISKKLPWS